MRTAAEVASAPEPAESDLPSDSPPEDDERTFAAKLAAMARRVDPRITGVSGIGRITAGATLQTFALDLEAPNAVIAEGVALGGNSSAREGVRRTTYDSSRQRPFHPNLRPTHERKDDSRGMGNHPTKPERAD